MYVPYWKIFNAQLVGTYMLTIPVMENIHFKQEMCFWDKIILFLRTYVVEHKLMTGQDHRFVWLIKLNFQIGAVFLLLTHIVLFCSFLVFCWLQMRLFFLVKYHFQMRALSCPAHVFHHNMYIMTAHQIWLHPSQNKKTLDKKRENDFQPMKDCRQTELANQKSKKWHYTFSAECLLVLRLVYNRIGQQNAAERTELCVTKQECKICSFDRS